VKVGELISTSGTIQNFQAGPHTIWFTEPPFQAVFKYTSQTQADKIVFPGGLLVDHPWNDLHPQGTLKFTLMVVPQLNAGLLLEVTVEPGHPDDPNEFVSKRIAPQVVAKIDAILENHMNIQVNT